MEFVKPSAILFDSIIPLFIIFAIIINILWQNFKSGNAIDIFRPSTFVCLVVIYYGLWGPLYTIFTNDLTYRGVNMSPYYTISWMGVAVMMVGYRLGLLLNINPLCKTYVEYDYKSLLRSSLIIFAIGFTMYILWMGSNISILIHGYNEKNEFHNEGNFVMYFMQGIAFFITTCCVLLWLWQKNYIKLKWWIYLIWILVLWIYLNSGFRFRLVFYVISMATMYYTTKKNRPNFLIWAGFGVAFILWMGVMEYARSYEKGLNFEKVEGMDSSDFLESGTNEARIFMASGAVMKLTENRGDYAYFDPILNALLMPLPYSIFPEKRAFLNYMDGRVDEVFGNRGTGVAVMEYAEAFVAFGWPGVLILGLFMGIMSKKIWLYFIRSEGEIIPTLTLSLCNGYVYIFISRGYLAQLLTSLFFYVIIPIWLLKILSNKTEKWEQISA